MHSKFKDEHPFEKRKAEAERIRQKYADRIPVPPSIPSLSATASLTFARSSARRSKVGHRHHRQEEVPGARRPDRRPVRLRHPQAHQAVAGEGHLHLRRRGPAAHRRPDELHIRGAQGTFASLCFYLADRRRSWSASCSSLIRGRTPLDSSLPLMPCVTALLQCLAGHVSAWRVLG